MAVEPAREPAPPLQDGAGADAAASGEVVRDVVVVGASAGGVETLRTLVAGLPPDFSAAVLVVLHVPGHVRSALPQILDRAGPLPVRQARSGDRVRPGQVLVATPDHHLLVHGGTVEVAYGPRENGTRPSIDVLFRSAAAALGPRVVGVVLSGTLDDGAAGLLAVRDRGGVAVVQDPTDARYPAMPRHAVESVAPEHVLPVAAIPALLDRLTRARAGALPVPPVPADPALELESAYARLDPQAVVRREPPGEPAGLTCPDCGGSLFHSDDSRLARFRCRVGHAHSSSSLLVGQLGSVETALWTAMRALEDRAVLTRSLAGRATDRGRPRGAAGFAAEAEEAEQAASAVRDLLVRVGDLHEVVPDGSADVLTEA